MHTKMNSGMLLSEEGQQMIKIGGDNARFQRVTGDIVSSYQYVNGEPAMVLWPKRHGFMTKRGAYAICLSAAWKYADMSYLVAAAHDAAQTMGFEESRSTTKRIMDIILDGLEDLVRMPPMPQHMHEDGRDLESVGEASITIDGREIDLGEIKA
jgi:hypothetical protein